MTVNVVLTYLRFSRHLDFEKCFKNKDTKLSLLKFETIAQSLAAFNIFCNIFLISNLFFDRLGQLIDVKTPHIY